MNMLWLADIPFILQRWQEVGVFSYMIPFLLIFAIVFGILTSSGFLGQNKGVNTIIALAVALLSLQLEFVPMFFSEIFPRLGVALAILLTALILIGLFVDWREKGWLGGFAAIGGIIAIITILSALSSYGWVNSWWWQEYWPYIIVGVLLVAAVIWVIVSSSKSSSSGSKIEIPLKKLHS